MLTLTARLAAHALGALLVFVVARWVGGWFMEPDTASTVAVVLAVIGFVLATIAPDPPREP